MSSIFVLAIGAALIALAAWWALRAYRRADAAPVSPRWPLAAAGLSAILAAGVYLFIGSPFLPDAAYADRIVALRNKPPETYTPDEAIAVLHAIAKERPRDAQPFVLIGDIEAQLGRAEPAANAFNKALRRDPNSVEALIGLGRVLAARDRGAVGAQALQIFSRARELAPQRAEPAFYLALAAQQAGEREEAARLWRQTLALLPEGDPRRAMVTQMLEQP